MSAVYALVCVDVNAEAVDRLFTYEAPEGMELAPGMQVVVPFGPRRLTGVVLELSGHTDVPPERLRRLLAVSQDPPALLTQLVELAKWMRETYHCTLAAALRVMLPAQLRMGKGKPLLRLCARLRVPAAEALASAARAPKQKALIACLASQPSGVRLDQVELDGALAAARALERKGVAEVYAQPVARRPAGNPLSEAAFTPTQEQKAAVDALSAAMSSGGGAFLLHGVTGSGKTEVYIQAIRQALQAGKGAIVLVPEISLTPQMVGWFRARFGGEAAVMHSRLSDGERYDEWRRIRLGEARVVIGARSAVFAPVEKLGLLIVDEEHEQSYQSETHPCYDARQVALQRCRLQGATLVLGSATPSVDTYARAMKGYYTLLEMPRRVAGRPLPSVHIVDMRKELIGGNRSIFSRALSDALEETLLAGRQAVLFINRRGHSSFVKCLSCGYTVHCPHCDVTMTYHLTDGRLHCHYCDTALPLPSVCPSCGGSYIKLFGIGTQKVEQVFKKEFPNAACLRMDNDTVKGKDALDALLSAFRRGEAQVLIGTQMVAKGHDFPGVTLVGVIMADLSLNLPDYRSQERTFQLLTQVEGRAGRGESPGRVVVQSYEPEHYAIQLAARQDYRAFYQEEIKRRRRRLYPPYTVMLRLLVTSGVEGEARAAAEQAEMELNEWFGQAGRRQSLVQLRAMEAPLGRIRDQYRYQVFIKLYAKGSGPALDFAAQLEQRLGASLEGVRVQVEINPSSFL